MKKIVILFLSVVLLTNCNKQQVEYPFDNVVQSAFTEDLNSLIPYEFIVDWSNYQIGFSKMLNSEYLEYEVIYTGKINPNNVDIARMENSNSAKADFRTAYKILAFKIGDSYQFYGAELKSFNSSKNSISVSDTEELSGFIKYTDSFGKETIEKYLNGQFVSNILRQPLKSIENKSSRCTYTTIVTTTTYYNVRPGGELEFNFETTSTETSVVCLLGGDGGSVDGPSGGGGGGSGGNGGGGNGDGSPSNQLTYSEDIVIPPPSCRSFEFQTVGNLNYQYSYVKGIQLLLLTNDNKSKMFLEWIDPIEFGAPLVDRFNNKYEAGVIATASALALQEAMDDTFSKYKNNAAVNVTENARRYFEERLVKVYPNYIPGGRVVIRPTKQWVPKVTTYKATWFGNDDCTL